MAFGNQRAFGGSLGVSPSQMVGGGWALGMGGQQLPTVLGNQLIDRGRPSLFSANPMLGFAAAQNNMGSLEHMGDQAFMGNQARQDRELENNLLQQQLRNALQLQGMRGQNNLDLQGLVNSGALDQINARGGWDRTIQGDSLSSQERRLAQQLGFDQYALNANLGSAAEDRQSRERMHGAGLNNALDLQSMQDRAAFERQKAALLGQQQLTGMEIGGRYGLQQLMGDQATEQQAQRGRMEMGLLKTRGQQSAEELRMQAAATAENLRRQLAVQRELGLGGQDTQRYLGELNAANQLLDTQSRNALGWAGVGNQKYAIDTNYDIAGLKNEQDAYQWANDHALRQQTAADAAAYNNARLAEDKRQHDNPQPTPVAPPPTRQALLQKAFENAYTQLPDGSPEEVQNYVDNYMSLMDQAAGGGQGQGQGQGGPLPSGMRGLSPETLIRQAQASDALLKMHPGTLMEALGPVLEGVTINNGQLSDADKQALAKRGITHRVLQNIIDYQPMWEGTDAHRNRFLIQRKAKTLREVLLGQ